MIDLEGIRALVAVDMMGTVAAAADTLGFTPSGVSQQVKRLERQLGLPVLERVGRGVILTPAGAALAREGRQLLEDADTLAARVRQQADSLN
ncbi:MAG: LysR family transcriptional regulator, partial [Micropruina sp.]